MRLPQIGQKPVMSSMIEQIDFWLEFNQFCARGSSAYVQPAFHKEEPT
jgi:hypothetical protein